MDMHTFLLGLRVNQRLTAAFTLLILITAGITGSGLWALNKTATHLDNIVNQTMSKIRYSTQMLDANARVVAAMQSLLLESDPTRYSSYTEQIAQGRQMYDTARDRLLEIPTLPEGLAIIQRIRDARERARPANQALVDLAVGGQRDAAIAEYEGSEALTLNWQELIRENITFQTEQAEYAKALAQQQTLTGRRLLLAGGVLALLVSAALALLITRSLVIPLRRSTAVADRIAAGDLSSLIVVQGRDETADLMRSMAGMQARLSQLIAAQRTLSDQQVAGIMSHRITDTDLPGAFGELVQASNALAEHNSEVIGQIVATAGRYSVGDLQVRMPGLPGEQAAITDAMETTRRNLLAVSSSIQTLAQAAARGDFSQRGDTQAFAHVFGEIIAHLNGLFDACDDSLGGLSGFLAAMAEGDLTQQARGHHEGVFAQMRDSANRTANNLRDIIAGIQASTQVISTSSAEIATGNSDLSQRTEQQAANLEETAASMEELTSTVRQNAEHARQANALATEAAHNVTEGGTAVAEVVATMERINDASHKVAEIISVIDGIAFQTNILALNAAVEAARAGEQGRGFAVVASEVRTLAQRSAVAAKDVKALIDGSTDEVRSGVALVRDAGERMTGIAGSMQQVRQAIAEIAAASQEQSAGIEQVNQAVVHMDEVTQQNAALVEEASAASRALQEQADALDKAVAVFRVAG